MVQKTTRIWCPSITASDSGHLICRVAVIMSGAASSARRSFSFTPLLRLLTASVNWYCP